MPEKGRDTSLPGEMWEEGMKRVLMKAMTPDSIFHCHTNLAPQKTKKGGKDAMYR